MRLVPLFLLLATIDGGTLVLDACVQCHDLTSIESQKKSEGAWRRTINEMVWRGAPLMPGEVDVLAKYLVERHAARASRPAQPSRPSTASGKTAALTPAARTTASPLPPGRGRDLVLGACVQCHDLELTTKARKTRDEWRHSVEQMARLGAKLNGTEVQIVTNYLARAFGRPSS